MAGNAENQTTVGGLQSLGVQSLEEFQELPMAKQLKTICSAVERALRRECRFDPKRWPEVDLWLAVLTDGVRCALSPSHVHSHGASSRARRPGTAAMRQDDALEWLFTTALSDVEFQVLGLDPEPTRRRLLRAVPCLKLMVARSVQHACR